MLMDGWIRPEWIVACVYCWPTEGKSFFSHHRRKINSGDDVIVKSFNIQIKIYWSGGKPASWSRDSDLNWDSERGIRPQWPQIFFKRGTCEFGEVGEKGSTPLGGWHATGATLPFSIDLHTATQGPKKGLVVIIGIGLRKEEALEMGREWSQEREKEKEIQGYGWGGLVPRWARAVEWVWIFHHICYVCFPVSLAHTEKRRFRSGLTGDSILQWMYACV